MMISFYRIVIPIALIVSLANCASYSPAQVQQQLALWNNTSLETLIGVFGVPAKQYVLESNRYVEWIKTEQDSGSSSISIGTGTGGRGWFSSLGVSLPIESTPDTCVIRATTTENENQVTKLDWQGDKNFCGEWLTELTKSSSNSKE
ncbi:MAG: hypothetical protein HWE27_15400 [Gammaproteobacteria bacterium]|nr:hypothetical protein [Gammaproteobacteria bacterium]